MIQFLIKTFIKNHEKTEDRAVRTAYGNLACIVSVVCNLLLAGGKIAVGVLTGSVAVPADGMNNLSDASSNIVSLLGFKLGARPADSEHPYGHARYEYLAGLAVSVMILVIGVELLKESFAKVLHPTAVDFNWVMVAVLAASILVKLWRARLNHKIGTDIIRIGDWNQFSQPTVTPVGRTNGIYTVTGCVHACHHASPAGCRICCSSIGVIEKQSFRGQTVYIRSFIIVTSHHTQISPAQIICKNEHDIRPVSFYIFCRKNLLHS